MLAFASCYSPRYVYSPSTQNIPVLLKKHDVNVEGYFASGGGSSKNGYRGSADYNLGIDIHSAYAVSNHMAIMLNQYNRWEKNDGANDFNFGDSSVIKYKRGLTEVGTGYFSSLNKASKNSLFQIFAGIAFGKFKINDNSLNNAIHFTRFHYADITKIFLQPAIVVGLQQNFTASFSSRFSEVFYKNISTDYTPIELDNYLLKDLSSSPVFFWEPAMNYSFGFKKFKGFKIDLQTGLAILLNRRFVDYRTINIALGVTANNDLFKRKHKTK